MKQLSYSQKKVKSQSNAEKEMKKKMVDLRETFIQNYGVEMEMPAYYIHDAKFVPNSINVILALVWSVIPDE